ncbi:MAG: hypothetical protein E7620_05425 [Ruminococcaceae bacterium]|nr:hypothetical protein [Oscillospiraceae bacterium]
MKAWETRTSVDEKGVKTVFFTVVYNHFRDVSESIAHEMRDRYEPAECECALRLPAGYTEAGEKTPLILCFHGAGGRVSDADNRVGGVAYADACTREGFAVLDVNGSELHGTTLGCPEHLFAAHKAYLYAISHYHLTDRVLVAGASMGGQTAMNFVNTFPSIVIAAGLIYPRLNMDTITVGDHVCIGTWDKIPPAYPQNTRARIADIYRFPNEEWCERNTIGFNPHRTRSFINCDGERVVIPPCPIKIWQGTDDPTVDCVTVQEFVESVRRGGCYIELHLLEGVVHKISPVMREELALWFERFV